MQCIQSRASSAHDCQAPMQADNYIRAYLLVHTALELSPMCQDDRSQTHHCPHRVARFHHLVLQQGGASTSLPRHLWPTLQCLQRQLLAVYNR